MSNKKVGVTAAALIALVTAATGLTVGADAASPSPVRQTQTFQAQATAQLTTASGFILADQDVQGPT